MAKCSCFLSISYSDNIIIKISILITVKSRVNINSYTVVKVVFRNTVSFLSPFGKEN